MSEGRRPARSHSPKRDMIRKHFAGQRADPDETDRQIEGEFQAVADKVRENRLRRAAERQGLRLEKSRRRDPRALGYGTYQLVDPYNSNAVVASRLPDGYGLDLDDVEGELNERR